jgi:hypothetical protein
LFLSDVLGEVRAHLTCGNQTLKETSCRGSLLFFKLKKMDAYSFGHQKFVRLRWIAEDGG